MRRSVIIVFVVMLLALAAKVKGATPELFAAIRQVETGGQPNGGRDAVGDGGRSIGPYQIGKAYWIDSGVPGRWEDVRDRTYAERVMLAYWKKYAPQALAAKDYETLARVHNGGPTGHRKQATVAYWRKVQSHLKGNP